MELYPNDDKIASWLNQHSPSRIWTFITALQRALSNINMEIEPHKVTALIGPSGCGKSTFLRCLNRMNDTIPGRAWRARSC